MAVGPDKSPVVRTIAPGLSVGVRMGGMGVALGTGVAESLATEVWESGRF